jgi:MFS family permease
MSEKMYLEMRVRHLVDAVVGLEKRGIRYYWILCIVGLFAILSSTMSKNPVLNLYSTSLGTPNAWTGLIAAASTIPGILISLPAGSLSDVLGRRKMLLISGIIFASAPFLYLFINSWWELIPIRFYHGFATAIFVPVANAAIVDLFPATKGARISTFSSMTLVGRGIAPFMGGYILSVTNNNYNDLYLAVGVAGVTALLVGLPFLLKKDLSPVATVGDGSAKAMVRGWGNVARNKSVQIVAFVESVQYYVYGTVEYFLVGYLKDVVGLDSFLIGVISGGYIIMVMLSKPFMGTLSDRIGRRPPIAFGAVVMGLPLIAIPFTTNYIAIIALTLVYGLGFAIVTSSTPALASEVVPKAFVGTSMGFLSTVMDVGQTIGPIISGFILASLFGYTGVFLSLTVLLVFSSAVFLLSGVGKGIPKEE